MTKLPYQEWRLKYAKTVDPFLAHTMKEVHGVDMIAEIELALQQEYARYVDQFIDLDRPCRNV